ncbi:MAG: cyclic nucleotide-binding domain-containing protein [Alphaproteobacteria bacterium]|jgi:CRP-like cAMP-binding protein|nr:cyclic nucleotide-binding domain-containing protein [Alphaproteobacteria bacterium]
MSGLGVLEQRLIKARQVITRRGDPGKRVYFVMSGSIQVAGGSESGVLEKGKMFGRIDILLGQDDVGSYTQTATALTESKLMFADAAQLREEIEKASPTVRTLLEHALQTST